MAKKPPTNNQHAFAAWVIATLPKACRVKIVATRTYLRREGFRGDEFSMRIALDYYGRKIEQTSHDLPTLATWLREVAIPVLFSPSAAPRPTAVRSESPPASRKVRP